MNDAETGARGLAALIFLINLDLFSFSLMLRYVIIGHYVRPGPRTPPASMRAGTPSRARISTKTSGPGLIP